MAPFTVRRAAEADAPAIAHIHVQSWRETYTGLISPDFLDRATNETARQRREDIWRATLSKHLGDVFVAEQGGGQADGGVPAARRALAERRAQAQHALDRLFPGHGARNGDPDRPRYLEVHPADDQPTQHPATGQRAHPALWAPLLREAAKTDRSLEPGLRPGAAEAAAGRAGTTSSCGS